LLLFPLEETLVVVVATAVVVVVVATVDAFVLLDLLISFEFSQTRCCRENVW